jgi:hypothetical protein
MPTIPFHPAVSRRPVDVLRVVRAFLLAPFVGIVVGGFVSSVLFTYGGLGGLGYGFLVMFGGAFFAYPFTFVIGVPLFLLMRHLVPVAVSCHRRPIRGGWLAHRIVSGAKFGVLCSRHWGGRLCSSLGIGGRRRLLGNGRA